MRKIILVLLTAIISFGIYAQESESANNKTDFKISKKYVYCEIMGSEKFMSSKINVNIDFGQAVSFWTPDRRYKDENGKAVTFNSMVDAMNFMGSLGWEFVQAYVVTVSNQNIYHWLLKMEIADDPF